MSMPKYAKLALSTAGMDRDKIAEKLSIFGIEVTGDDLARRMANGRDAKFKSLTKEHPGLRAYVERGRGIVLRITPAVVGYEQKLDRKTGERVVRRKTLNFCKKLGPALKHAGFRQLGSAQDTTGVLEERFGVKFPVGLKPKGAKTAPRKPAAAKAEPAEAEKKAA